MMVHQLLFKVLKIKIAGDRDPATFEIWLTWFTHIAARWDHKGDKVLPGIGGLNDLRRVPHVWPRLGGRTCGLGHGRIMTGYGDQSIVLKNCAWAGIIIFRVWQLFLVSEVAFCTDMLHRDWSMPHAQTHNATPPYYIHLFDRGDKTRLALMLAMSEFRIWFWLPPMGRLVDWTAGRRSLQLDWVYGSNTSACS